MSWLIKHRRTNGSFRRTTRQEAAAKLTFERLEDRLCLSGSPLDPILGAPEPPLIVGGDNQPPVAIDDSYSVQQDTPTTLAVTANDFDPDGFVIPLSIVVTQAPTHGTLVLPAAGDPLPPGIVMYTPDAGYLGPDNFAYTIADNAEAVSNEAIVQLDVLPGPPPPPSPPPTEITFGNSKAKVSLIISETNFDLRLPSGAVKSL